MPTADGAQVERAPDHSTPVTRSRRWLLAGTTALAPLVLLGTLPFEVSTGDADSGIESLTIIAADRGQFYATGLALAIGLAMLGLSSLAIMQVVRGRGGVLATVGGCLLLVGGISASAAIFMYTVVNHAMTDPAMDRQAMAALDTTASDSVQAGIPFMIGFPGLALGLLLCGVALLRSGAVPLYVSIPVLLSGPALMVGGDGWGFALSLSALLALTGVAVELVRPQPRTVSLPQGPAQVPGQTRAGSVDVTSPTTTGA
jgi:hypothetical protein